MVKHYEIHPLNVTRDFNGSERKKMREDLMNRGQVRPIYLLEGKIIDGKNRYALLAELGKEPWVENVGLSGMSPHDWVCAQRKTANPRGKLSPNERLVLAATARRKGHGGDRSKPCRKGLLDELPTLEDLCQLHEVKKSSLEAMSRVLKCHVNDITKIMSAGFTLKTADKIAKRFKDDAERQQEFFDLGDEEAKSRLSKLEKSEKARAAKEAEEKARAEVLASIQENELEEDVIADEPASESTPARATKASEKRKVKKAGSKVSQEKPEEPRPKSHSGVPSLVEVFEFACQLSPEDRVNLIERIFGGLPDGEKDEARSTINARGQQSLLEFVPKHADLPGKLDCPEFHEKWIEWCEYRESTVAGALSEEEAKEQLDKLKHKSTATRAMEFIDYAMDRGKPQPYTKPSTRRAVSFVKPTLEQLKAYIKERKYGVDPEAFLDHYESNGWMVSSNRMVNWKSSVNNWERRDQQQPLGRGGGGGRKKRDSRFSDRFHEEMAKDEGL